MSTTWNPSDKHVNVSLSNGNLTASTHLSAWAAVRATDSKSSGKWYWEVKLETSGSECIGIGTLNADLSNYVGSDIYGYSYRYNGKRCHYGSMVDWGDAYGVNDIIGIALDLDSGKIWWSKNGVWQASGDPANGTNEAYSGLSGAFFPMFSLYGSGDSGTARFISGDLTYTPPTGFTAFGYEEGFSNLNTEIAANPYCFSDVLTEIAADFLTDFLDLLTDISASAEIISDLNSDIAADFLTDFLDLLTDISASVEIILDLDSEIKADAERLSDFTSAISALYPIRERFLLLRYDHVPARNEQNVRVGEAMQFRLYNPNPAFGIDLTTFKLRFDGGAWYRYGNSRFTFTKMSYREYLVYFNPPTLSYDSQITIEVYCEDHLNNPGIKLEIL